MLQTDSGIFNAGTLDTSFGNNGTVVTPSAGFAHSITLQDDGKLLVAGTTLGGSSFALGRYTNDGRLDSSFGAGGIVTTNFYTPPPFLSGFDTEIGFSVLTQADELMQIRLRPT
ncbi:hypothetical protein OsccyDRAFT_1137 [Leptolyngbyaceae cyanobacterium JSC-12]|nr:hypothetical protein OsccyDRAFT_1137 [Leptolyngbyaceae cyanobacterium JSC-12]